MSDTFFCKDFILLLIHYSFFLIERKLYDVHVIYCNLTIYIINSYLFYSQAFLYIFYIYIYIYIYYVYIYIFFFFFKFLEQH